MFSEASFTTSKQSFYRRVRDLNINYFSDSCHLSKRRIFSASAVHAYERQLTADAVTFALQYYQPQRVKTTNSRAGAVFTAVT